MEEQVINIKAGTDPTLTVAGDILNAYYSALILEKLSGHDITDEIRYKTLNDVKAEWGNLQKFVRKCIQGQKAQEQ